MGTGRMEDFAQSNLELDAIGRQLFGGEATLRIVDPRALMFRRMNARFFKKEVFERLVENIRGDGRLSSVPLCHEPVAGRLEVLSGKHRVEACILADIERILVIVLLVPLDPARQVAIQLSHNALVGEDDPQILAKLFACIDSIQGRLYAGLSSDAMGEIKKVELVQFKTPATLTRAVTFAFTEPELGNVESVLEELRAYQGSSVIFLARDDTFEVFFKTLQGVKKSENIKNASLGMARLCELAKEHLS